MFYKISSSIDCFVPKAGFSMQQPTLTLCFNTTHVCDDVASAGDKVRMPKALGIIKHGNDHGRYAK